MMENNKNIYGGLISKRSKMGVIGLGYVGLPIALAFAKKIRVVGFDIREDRINSMRNRIDPCNELPPEAFLDCDIQFTSSREDLAGARFYVITVPTPIDEHNLPDLSPLLKATEMTGSVLKKGDYVVYESTVYPGCTGEECVPLLEGVSGLTCGDDFKVGYSPERINPGDRKHTLTSITKIVSGCDRESAGTIEKVYRLVMGDNIFRTSSIKVAEAAKIIENTQRDINIAFMNELSMIFGKMNLNTWEVLEAAGTKWNFLRFVPGLVGGHCIGVDPYYLSYKAKKFGHHAQIINSGRSINDGMVKYVAEQLVKKIIGARNNLRNAQVLIMGITFKENVSDIRNSRVVDVVRELQSYNISVDITDPHVSDRELQEVYGLKLVREPGGGYAAVLVAVNHREYENLTESYFSGLGEKNMVLADLKGIYRNKIKKLDYWTL